MTKTSAVPHPDRYFSSSPAQRDVARQLYAAVAALPLVCPHGHVDPRLFADPHYSFGSPAELLIIPDHYIFRMLHSQGVSLDALGIPRRDGGSTERDHRRIWQRFAEHYHLFRGTPTGIWLRDELADVFGISEKLTPGNAQAIYDAIDERLHLPEYRPRALFERFNIEVLCTTDPATSTLEHHKAIRASGWRGRILPTFRPDAVINIDAPGWNEQLARLSELSGIDIGDYASYISALEQRRAFFREMGATATDHAALSAHVEALSPVECDALFARARRGDASLNDTARFTAHMLMEMARMSAEDGMVMQLHIGSMRNHNSALYEQFGPDMGADIPVTSEFTRNLQPLLNRFGSHPNFTLILFNLDESTYSRELAPLAGHYPAVKIGPPWWFFDSLNGMARFFDRVMETAGIYNTAGFNDDTRAYPSIPARHDLWRRAAADWLAGLVVRHIIDEEDALAMARSLAYDLARSAYRL